MTEEIENFDTICNEITDCGQFQTFSGAIVTHVHCFSDNLNWINTLSIFPRIHEVKNRAMVNEPLNPGSFSSMFMGNYAGMPFRVNFSQGFWLPELSLTVPVGSAKMELSASVNDKLSPTIKADLCHQAKKVALAGSLLTFDNFSRGLIDFSAATKVKDLKLGAYMSLKLDDKQWSTRWCIDKETKKGFALGTYIGITQEGVSGVARVKKTIGSTTASASLHLVPKMLGSELYVAMERNFTMSSVLGAISSSGTVKSCWVRHIDSKMRITMTSESNVVQGSHSFGISLTIQ